MVDHRCPLCGGGLRLYEEGTFSRRINPRTGRIEPSRRAENTVHAMINCSECGKGFWRTKDGYTLAEDKST